MQAQSVQKSSDPSKPPPFFAVQPQREPAFFPQLQGASPDLVQRKCATCDQTDDKLQRQADTGQEDPLQLKAETPPVQRKCSACDSEDKLQRREEAPEEERPQLKDEAPATQGGLHITPPDDPQEHEADRVAEMVMRMPATQTAEAGANAPGGDVSRAPEVSGGDPGVVQRDCEECTIPGATHDEKTEDKDPEAELSETDDPATAIGGASSGGSAGDADADAGADTGAVSPKSERSAATPMPANLPSALKSSRGGGRPLPKALRNHMENRFGEDFSAVRIHADSSAAAMTKSIHAQAFTSGSDIFFNPHRYDPASTTGQTLLAHELTHVVQQKGTNPLRRKIQRSEEHGRMGNWAHEKIQEALRSKDDLLITEAGIPGATRHGKKINNAGFADLYRSPGSRIGGVQANISGADGDVTDVKYTYKNFLDSGKRLKNIKSKSPFHIGPKIRKDKSWDFSTNFPASFEIGELKPLFPTEFTESMLYHGSAPLQIQHYIDGFGEFVEQVHKDKGAPVPATTVGAPINIPENKIPDAINYRKFEQERDQKNAGAILKKSVKLDADETTPRVWVYQTQPGMFVYFLISHPFSPKAFRPGLDAQLEKLKPIVKELKDGKPAKMGTSIDSKREPGTPVISRQTTARRINRKDDDWSKNAGAWEKKRKEWVQGSGKTAKPKKFLKDLAKGHEKKGKVDKRLNISTGKAEQDDVKNIKDVRFWSSWKGRIFGALYFRFRKVFVKIEELFAKIKAKFQKHRAKADKLNEKGGIFSDWKKVATEVIIRLAVMIFKDMVSIAFTGFMNCINAIVEGITGKYVKQIEETAQEKLKEVQPLCCGIMEFKHKFDAEVEKHEKVITEFTDAVDTIKKWQSILSDVEMAVRIGVEVVSCGLPPGLGCLWGLVAQLGISGGLSLLMRTSYFDKHIAQPAANAIMESIVGDKLHNLMIDALELTPLKDHMQGLGACSRRTRGGGGTGGNGIGGHLDELDPNNPEIAKIRQEWEAQNKDKILKDLQEVFEKGDKTPMSEAEIQQLIEALKKSKKTPEELKKMLRVGKNAKTGKFDFDKALTQVASDEVPKQEAPKDRKIDYKSAQQQNKYYEQKIKWDPTTFIKVPGTQADSKEFAEAVYDMQQAIGAHADGVAGPDTTTRFYDTNNLPKDKAYDAAQKAGKEEADAKDKAKSKANRDKVVDELLKDKGIVDALNKQFPADSELRKDLTALHWENLDAGTMQFINRNGRFIVGAKTEAGHSFGAYFNFTEREFQGQKRTMVVITSKFFAVDDLTEDDMYSVQSSPDSHTFGIEINLTGAHPKGTFFDLPPLLFGKFVDIN